MDVVQRGHDNVPRLYLIKGKRPLSDFKSDMINMWERFNKYKCEMFMSQGKDVLKIVNIWISALLSLPY